jgi:putative FmdB family regulatory protein
LLREIANKSIFEKAARRMPFAPATNRAFSKRGEEVPTYGYQCNQCKHEFQVFQSMKDDPISVCPECKGAVKRLLYPVGVVFKGSGWYINDSRKPEKSEESQSKPSESKPAETTSSDTKTEAPAAAAGSEK